MRICYTCDEFKPLECFYYRKNRSNYHTTCKACLCEQAKGRCEKQSTGYKELTKKRKRLYMSQRLASDPAFKILHNLRRRMRSAINGSFKCNTTRQLLGCTTDAIRNHLEARFTKGMSWHNYGIKGWHIDHIKPCASFDLTDPEEQRQCFHYTNLQPLWAEENIKKGSKYYG